MIDPVYPANFAVQALALSGLSLLLLACVRGCERRARAALLGVLICGSGPFFSSFSPVKERVIPSHVVETRRSFDVPPAPEVEPQVPAIIPEIAPVTEIVSASRKTPGRRHDPVPWLMAIWLAGSAVGAGLMAREVVRSRRWQRTISGPSGSDGEKLRVHLPDGVAADRVGISTHIPGPCVIGFWKPRIVIPRWLVETSDPRELAWALRHESEHLRGQDSRWMHVISFLRIFQWWNPLLHLLIGIWSHAREQAADLQAAGLPYARADYGHFLLKVAGSRTGGLATFMAFTSRSKRLRQRIAILLKPGTPEAAAAGPAWTLLMTCIMTLVAVFTSVVGFAKPPGPNPLDADASTNLPEWLNPLPQVYLQTAVVLSSEPFAKHGEILNDEELKERLARFVAREGFHFQSLDPHLQRAGSPLTVQMTVNRDTTVTDPPWDGENVIDPFVGWVIHYDPEATKEDVMLGVRAAYAFLPGDHPAPGLILDVPPGFRIQSIREIGLSNPSAMATANQTTRVNSREILSTSLGEVEAGVYAVCLTGLVTRMPWDPSSITEFSSLSMPSHEWPGIVVTTKILPLEHSPQQKRLSDNVARLRNELSAKVEAHPANKSLLELRKGLQIELDESLRLEDTGSVHRLRWQIRKVTEKMKENIRSVYDSEEVEIRKSEKTILESMFKLRLLDSDEKQDPTRFNHGEQ